MNFNEMEKLNLFKGLNSTEIRHFCECFGASVRHFKKGKAVVHEGDTVKQFGVVIGGEAKSYKSDISGKRFTVSVIKEGGYIGALLAGMTQAPSPVTVEATDRLSVLFVPFNKLILQCDRNCRCHTKILNNFIGGISEKAMFLYERIDCLIKPTVREKIFMFLGRYTKTGESFEIEFDREGLADYLNVDRSALSRELSRMKREGIIDYNRNVFRVL
jgi:CRP-like cAMP-binding protein